MLVNDNLITKLITKVANGKLNYKNLRNISFSSKSY